MLETEEQMLARIEAEERARLEFEEPSPDPAAATAAGELQPASEETESQMRARIEAEERKRLDDTADGLADGRYMRLLPLAKRFVLLGVVAWGGRTQQVDQLRAQDWTVVDDEGFESLLALVECLPGPTSTLLAAALGLLHGGVGGGAVAALCYVCPSMLALTTLGWAAHAALGDGALRFALGMGLAAALLSGIGSCPA